MIDLKLLGGFGDGQTDRRTDGRTDERTLVIVESLSRLKSFFSSCTIWLFTREFQKDNESKE